MKEMQSTAIIGMGALGMLYASQIQDTLGPDAVTFVAEPERAARYRTMTFSVNGVPKQFSIADSRTCTPADLVIVAVKYNALQSALDTMARCVGPDTTIISVMNGISSEQIIGERYGMEKVIGCIAQGMDAVKFDGALTYSRPGELRIGVLSEDPSGADCEGHTGNPSGTDCEGHTANPSGTDCADHTANPSAARLDALTHYLSSAGVPYTVESDIRFRLWGKFMLNVGINQTCMAFETNYGGALAPGKPFDTMTGAMREVIALANLEGIPLTEADLDAYLDLLRTLSPTGMPSMRQDGIAHRPSEVEMFAGTVRKLAAGHGLAVPVNDWLYEKIKKLEAMY